MGGGGQKIENALSHDADCPTEWPISYHPVIPNFNIMTTSLGYFIQPQRISFTTPKCTRATKATDKMY